jgi:hypothetical protein
MVLLDDAALHPGIDHNEDKDDVGVCHRGAARVHPVDQK